MPFQLLDALRAGSPATPQIDDELCGHRESPGME